MTIAVDGPYNFNKHNIQYFIMIFESMHYVECLDLIMLQSRHEFQNGCLQLALSSLGQVKRMFSELCYVTSSRNVCRAKITSSKTSYMYSLR